MYEAKTFDIPELKGISAKTIEEHMKLYQGYVKHTNLILEKIASGADGYDISEMRRRFGFEFNGMRNHEYCFEQLENGPVAWNESSQLAKQYEKDFGSGKIGNEDFKKLAGTRGPGWATVYYDKVADRLLHTWVDEQHLGQLNGLDFIFGLDMWEHSYMLDYVPGDKMKYVDAYLKNVNWKVVEDRFEKAKNK